MSLPDARMGPEVPSTSGLFLFAGKSAHYRCILTDMKKVDRAVKAIVKMQKRAARSRYAYFVVGDAEGGFRWLLIDAYGDHIATSDLFDDKSDCVKNLRANQRHAATTVINDETH